MNRRLIRHYIGIVRTWVGDLFFLVWQLRWYIVVAFVAIVAIVLLWNSSVDARRRNAKTKVRPAPIVVVRRAIDNAVVRSATDQDPMYAAVMIDNMNQAWPQAGVQNASVVIEAPVESPMTRLIAIYPVTVGVTQIGPVRSSRPYFLDIAEEYDAIYAHVGGSPAALDRISLGGVRDVNQFFQDKYFWRDGNRSAPHNVYTSSALLAGAANSLLGQVKKRPLAPWVYADVRSRGTVSAVMIPYSAPYQVTWQYDAVNNWYVRYVGGKKLLASSGEEIRTKNILVQYVSGAILDEVGRRRIDLIGTGKAVVFRNGEAVTGTWKKPSVKERTRFYDEKGVEVALASGVSWIEIVPKELTAKW